MRRSLSYLVIAGGVVALAYAGREYQHRRNGAAVPGGAGASGSPSAAAVTPQDPARNQSLITSSVLLRKLGIRIYPADNTAGTIKIPTKAVGGGLAFYLLGKDDKVYDLAPSPMGEQTIAWGCGDGQEFPASAFSVAGGASAQGNLVVIGRAESKSQIHWTAATSTEIEKGPDSLVYKPGYKMGSVFYSSSGGLPQGSHIYTASWWSPQYTTEPPADANTHPETCTDWTHEQVGFMSAQGASRVLFDNPVNCDGQGYHDGTVGNLMGVLEVSSGVDHETWLLFEANGYEGSAYLSFKVDFERLEPQSAPDFLVYSGC